MIDEDTCQFIADWSLRLRLPGFADVRAIVDREQPEGYVVLDSELREARFHPEDFMALRRWVDRQSVV